MASVSIEHLGKTFPDGTTALRDFSLEIEDGELIVFVGPSGCGKTTALRIVAGLEDATTGNIKIDGELVNHVPPQDRDIAMVFQSYALYPYKTVFENIAFPLRLRREPRASVTKRVNEVANLLGLEDYLKRKPRQLSGGQRQRVAMGRAIVREPRLFLMDEPLSNLDAKLRMQMRAEIAELRDRLGVTTIYVTHDQVEAMTLGDRVVVLRKGELQQVATAQEMYVNPANLFVAGFIGSPAMNLFEAHVTQNGHGLKVEFGDQSLYLDERELQRWNGSLERFVGRKVVLGLRPESVGDAALDRGAPDTRRFRAQAELVETLGSEVVVHFGVDAEPVVTEDVRELARDVDASALAELERMRGARRTTCVGRFAPSTTVRKGDMFEVAVEPGSLHFFDLEDGTALRP
jgi:multiple sugar transport system ATP-binding protein